MTTIEARLKELNIELPEVPKPIGRFVLGVQHGDLLFLSGQGPLGKDGQYGKGKVGADVTVDEAQKHARDVGLVMVAAMREVLGSLERVDRIVKVLGMVNATLDFEEHPKVINGCSNLFHEIFEKRGEHARSAIGVASLPMGISVEVEAIIAVKPDT